MEDVRSSATASLFTEIGNTSSPAPAGEQPSDPFAFQFFNIAMALLRICPPIILCVGTLGNVMTVVIMRRLTSDDTTINIYFTVIAVVDLMYLWTIVFNQVIQHNVGYDFKLVHSTFCKVFTWLYTGGGTVSAWCLVCMTVHRAMSVVWPHRVNVLCTRRTVLLMLTAVTVIIAVLYLHYLLGLGVISFDKGKSYRCTLTTREFGIFHTTVFVYIELLVYCVLPFVMIVVANSVLTWKLVASAKRANRNLTEGLSAQAQIREKAANSVTLTVMAVSFTFLVLTLPSTVNFILNHLTYFGRVQKSRPEQLRVYATSFICNMLSEINHAINFYLYIVTGRRFREEFIKVLCCGRGGLHLPSGSGNKAGSG